MKRKQGFTIVEILVVLAILAILMVIAVPSIMNMSGRMKDRGLISKIEAIKSAAVNYAQGNSNRIKAEILSNNPEYSECSSDNGTWCRCENSASGKDCKYVFVLTVDDLVQLGAYKSEHTSNSKSTCDVLNPVNNKCLDCLKVEIHLDDEYKSADAYVNEDEIEGLNGDNCLSGGGYLR